MLEQEDKQVSFQDNNYKIKREREGGERQTDRQTERERQKEAERASQATLTGLLSTRTSALENTPI